MLKVHTANVATQHTTIDTFNDQKSKDETYAALYFNQKI